jgi:hypothetical protein
MEVCKICDKEINTNRGLAIHIKRIHNLSSEEYYNKYVQTDPNEGKCLSCGKKTTFEGREVIKYREFCSTKCSHSFERTKERKKKVYLERYGVENISQLESTKKQKEEAYLRKYGVKTPLSDKDKMKRAIQDKYGEEYTNISQVPKIREKIKNVVLERHGVENVSQLESVKKRKEETTLEHYGVRHHMHIPEIQQKVSTNSSTAYKLLEYKTKFGDLIHYQSTFELSYIKQCEEDGIKIVDGDDVSYTFGNEERRYYVDFKIFDENDKPQLIEIKGTHKWYWKDLKSGLLSAKNKAAQEFSSTNGYSPFKMILNGNVADLEEIL